MVVFLVKVAFAELRRQQYEGDSVDLKLINDYKLCAYKTTSKQNFIVVDWACRIFVIPRFL